jgi:hypothetical protein
MKLKRRILALTAGAALLGGIAVAATPVSSWAGTPSCGGNCVNIFSREFGTHTTPGYVVDDLRQGERTGQPIILFRAANYDPAEDWAVSFQGDVSDFYEAGLVSSALDLHYGCGYSLQTGTCSATVNPVTGRPFPDDYAFEIEYSPYGVESGLCAGVGATAAAGTPVALEPCGDSSKTVWVVDQADASNGSVNPALDEYVPLINGSDTNFSQPFVLTYPSDGYPTNMPRPQFTTQNITGFSNPGTGDPEGVEDNQLFGVTLGVLK